VDAGISPTGIVVNLADVQRVKQRACVTSSEELCDPIRAGLVAQKGD
jgi:hypothetical protein